MAPPTGQACTCTTDGYSPECPNTFMQGGRRLHTIENETQLKPRQFLGSTGTIVPVEAIRGPSENSASSEHRGYSSSEDLITDFQQRIGYPNTETAVMPGHGATRLRGVERAADSSVSSEGLKLRSGGQLDKFKSLVIGGESLTSATIGGYHFDVAKMKEKVEEILPLPPVPLPLIFVDNDLNFLHLFFQGLEMMGGREFITLISEVGTYSGRDTTKICPLIERLCGEGYKEEDDDLVVFVKRVMSSTFEKMATPTSGKNPKTFLVVSNFYGFQYIECGMCCREQDLKMWLHSAYNQYRNSWFNVMKSTGLPSFAMQGVQDRYDSEVKKKSSALLERGRKDLRESNDEPHDEQYKKSYRSHRRHEGRKSQAQQKSKYSHIFYNT